MRSILNGLLCATVFPAVMSSQAVGDLTAGQRLRVTLEKRVTGTLVSIDTATLILDAGAPSGRLPYRLDQVRRLEVSDGRHARLKMARLGFMAGAALGGLVGAVQKEGGFLFSSGDILIMRAGAGAVAGFVAGLALPRGEQWVPVSISVSQTPSSAGIGLGSPLGRGDRP